MYRLRGGHTAARDAATAFLLLQLLHCTGWQQTLPWLHKSSAVAGLAAPCIPCSAAALLMSYAAPFPAAALS
jgi:hypothetical protein